MTPPIYLCRDCVAEAAKGHKVVCVTPDNYLQTACGQCGLWGCFRAYELREKEGTK